MDVVSFDKWSYMAQSGLKTTLVKDGLEILMSSLYLLSAEITDMYHHT